MTFFLKSHLRETRKIIHNPYCVIHFTRYNISQPATRNLLINDTLCQCAHNATTKSAKKKCANADADLASTVVALMKATTKRPISKNKTGYEPCFLFVIWAYINNPTKLTAIIPPTESKNLYAKLLFPCKKVKSDLLSKFVAFTSMRVNRAI